MENKNWSLRNRGFSLVELIFAVIMLTVIVFGVIKLQTSNLTLSNAQNNELKAHFLANQAAEITEAIGYDNIVCTSPCKINKTGSFYTLQTSVSPEEIDGTPFTRRIELDDTYLTDAYKATAIVEWTDSAGEHTVEVKRIIY